MVAGGATALVGISCWILVCQGYQPSVLPRRRTFGVSLRNAIGNSDTADIPGNIDVSDSSDVSDALGDLAAVDSLDTLEPGVDSSHATNVPLSSVATVPPRRSRRRRSSATEVSRRGWLQSATVLLAGTVIGGGTVYHNVEPSLKKLRAVNLEEVVKSTSLNVTVEGPLTCVALDGTSFQKKQILKLPNWVPPALVPPPRVIRDITNQELLFAAIVAGSVLEMTRTSILYPLLTLKTRVQTDIKKRRRRRKKRIKLGRRWKISQLNARRHIEEGKLYAGIVPSLLVSVPATGVYYGVRDIVKRGLAPLGINTISIALTAAFCADVIAILIRTPADALAIRLQKVSGEESSSEDDVDEEEREAIVKVKVGNWFVESLERLPAITLTDLPYLLSRIALNRSIIQGHVDIGRYELVVISTAIVCGILTTPFDVARTRILVDSDDDPNNGIDGGSGEGLVTTFQTIMDEGDGGFSNLFAGWFERTTYLAIGRAWLEPLQIIGYVALRDAILLEWFD